MHASLHSKEVTTAQVTSVRFGFFDDDEIRKVSVKRIESPIVVDNNNQPVADGLYDSAMGPLDSRERCMTCGLTSSCPGHFGHVELAVPVYNPLVFGTMYKLLRSSCLHCFKLRMKDSEVELYASRLRLLAKGRLADSAGVETNVRRGAKDAVSPGKDAGDAMDVDANGAAAGAGAGSGSGSGGSPASSAGSSPRAPGTPPREGACGARQAAPAPTAHTLEAMQDTIAELFRRQPVGKCANCGAFSPVLKREGLTKLFLVPLAAKRAAANEARNVTVLPTLSRMRRPDEAEAERTLARRLGGRDGGLQAALAGQSGASADAKGLVLRPDNASTFAAELTREAAASPGGLEPALAASVQRALDAARGHEASGIPAAVLEGIQQALDAALAGARGGYVPSAAERAAGPTPRQLEAAEKAGALGGGEGGLPAAPDAVSPASQLPAYLTPAEVMEIMRAIWSANTDILGLIYPTDVAGRARRRGASSASAAAAGAAAARAALRRGYEEFFLRTIAVAPNKFRAPSRMGDQMYEHPQNALLVKAINDNLELLRLRSLDQLEPEAEGADARILYRWLSLQNVVNTFIDSAAADGRAEGQGIRQTLERKEGLFRKNMMGKRVNFAARSVISPDPGLNGGEIGIPPYIAARLSFPERVTPWNVERLCEAVLAGPGKNPGATAVEDERGRVLMLRDDRASREAVARRLAADARRADALGGATAPVTGAFPRTGDSLARAAAATTSPPASLSSGDASGAPELSLFGGCKVVYRSLEDGDIMLTNRQPTLHKPGVLAHRARIMRGERTIRMHYANCSTFNADFDGDEINVHLPQDQLGRAEGYGIVGADHQFFVPTDGKPLRGLIQDHVVAGTLLTSRDTFLDRARAAALVHEAVGADCPGAWEVWMPEPAVLAPRECFTGKQVLTAVLVHYTRDQLPFSLETATKVPVSEWGASSGEGRLIVRNSHLVAGVIDKAAFGKHGLLHLFHELYGARRTSLLTASLSRLFTFYLQQHGFTCGLADVVLDGRAEAERAGLLTSADDRCAGAARGMVATELGLEDGGDRGSAAATGAGAAAEPSRPRVRGALRARLRANPDLGALLDMKSSGAMHPLSSEVVKTCLPSGQVRPFRHNMMALMTVTGAKGSVVNFSQISCLLGQQELEGRRVPRMASGKTLPCFEPYDVGARSGGFVGDRFLTGLRPQEYYFHCMAGREGLVDTTVKTSRSGYLQRCLVKNLETLKVGYDGSVRDDADASVVQFAYGDDGIDTTRTGCLRTLPFFYYNMPQLARHLGLDRAQDADALERGGDGAKDATGASIKLEGGADAAASALAPLRKIKTEKPSKEKGPSLSPPVTPTRAPAEEAEARFRALAKAAAAGEASRHLAETLPASLALPASTPGVASEGFQTALASAMFGGLLRPPCDPHEVDEAFSASTSGGKVAVGSQRPVTPLDPADFVRIMNERYALSLSAPGEAVGVIAAQSIGEPSTQMTLNTFHMAGRGEANVTLGIPRLREILMTAARSIKTPVMTLPLRRDAGPAAAAMLAARLRRVLLAETLRSLRVEHATLTRAGDSAGAGLARSYTVTLRFHPDTAYPSELKLRFRELAAAVRAGFVPRLQSAIKAEIRRASTGNAVASVTLASVGEGAEGGGRRGGEDAAGEGAAGRAHAAATGPDDDDAVPEDDDDDEREANAENLDAKMERGGGGPRERATYESEDDDDAAIAAAARRQAAATGGAEGLQLDSEDEDEGEQDEDEEDDGGERRAAAAKSARKKALGAARAATSSPGSAVDPLDAGTPASASASAPGVFVDARSRSVRVCVHVPHDAPVLLMREVAERVAAEVVVRGTRGVSKCYVLDGSGPGRGGQDAVQTDGINVAGAWSHADIADVDALGLNSPGDVLAAYGVEAARAAIVGEVGAVFGAYGIGVDPRHLSLIADVMTRRGAYAPLNRLGIQASPSPFLKITFETAAAFLVAATLHGNVDSLEAPASRIVVGRPVGLGTGALEVLHTAQEV